jgi:hypothetical protein
LIDWNLKALMRDWGEMSHFLHWVGARGLTTEDSAWLLAAHKRIVATVKPLWLNLTSGRSAMLHPKDMHPIAKGVWEEFKRGEIDEATVKFRLTVLRPAGA